MSNGIIKQYVGRHHYLEVACTIYSKEKIIDINNHFRNPLSNSEIKSILNDSKNHSYNKEFAEFFLENSYAEQYLCMDCKLLFSDDIYCKYYGHCPVCNSYHIIDEVEFYNQHINP